MTNQSTQTLNQISIGSRGMMHFCCIVLLICSGFTKSFGQAASFEQYTVEEGLPSNETYQVFQDSKGYIWIATDRGIVRFDGQSFQRYTTEDGLPDNTVFHFLEDDQQRIWFYTYNANLGYYDNVRDEFVQLLKQDDGKGVKGTFISSINVRNDTISVMENSRSGAVSRTYYIQDSICELISETPSRLLLTNTSYNEQLEYPVSVKNLTDTNAFRYSGMSVHSDHDQKRESSREYLRISKDTILIYTMNWVGVYQISTQTMLYEEHFPDWARAFELIDGTIYLLIRNDGLYVLDQSDFHSTKILDIPFDMSGMYRDRTGTIWVTTLTSGVLRYNNIDIKAHEEVTGKNIVSLFHNNYLWVKANEDLMIGKGDSLVKSNVSITNRMIREIYPLSDERLLLFSSFAYLVDNDRIQNIDWNNLNYTPYGFVVMSQDTLVIVYKGGYVRESIATFKSGKFTTSNLYSSDIGDINASLYRSKDEIWVGGKRGAFILNTQNGKIENPQSEHPLLKNRIQSMSKLDASTLVFSTIGSGILIGNLSTGFRRISKTEGLIGNMVADVALDTVRNLIWVGTSEGLSRVKLKSMIPLEYDIMNFAKEDGLLSRQVTQLCIFHDSLYVGTSRGLNYFPVDYEKKFFKPGILIEKVRINGRDTISQDNYDLPFQQNSVEIEFHSMVYKGAESVYFKSRMLVEGDTSAWNYSNNRSVQFFNLAPGSYSFEVLAVNHDGLASERPAVIHIHIRPPWWRTWWAFSIWSGVMLTIIYIIFRIRVRRSQEKERVKRRMVEMELKALRSQMNPHFTFNTMNSIQHFISSQQSEEASNYISIFSKLMRMILDNSREEYVLISQELEALTLYLEIEKLRLRGEFDFEIRMDDEIDPDYYKMPPMVIQPFAENAIWHGLMNKTGDRKLNISLSLLSESMILCMVEDNGVGRDEAAKIKSRFKSHHKSHGVNITNTRLELLNSLKDDKLESKIIDLFDDAGNPSGTRVELYIPVN